VARQPARRGRGERLRRFVRERDWEFAFKRSAMLLVIPAVLLIGAAVSVGESGCTWWDLDHGGAPSVLPGQARKIPRLLTGGLDIKVDGEGRASRVPRSAEGSR
jgi:hypothetical protein